MKLTLDPGAAALLDALHTAGYAAYAVGGCVRDSLLGRTAHDWDLCTSALPQQVMELFGAKQCIPTGLQHGTVTIKYGGQLYETTTFRTEFFPQSNYEYGSGVELEVSGEVFIFDRHVYDFQAPESLTDSSDLLTYKLLCQGAGLGLESMYQDGTYREYALVWEDYVLGYLTTDVGCWTLYIPGSLELDDSPSGSGESSGGSGGISGGFQNDSFGIVVEPGEQVPDSVPQEYRCESCGGSGFPAGRRLTDVTSWK